MWWPTWGGSKGWKEGNWFIVWRGGTGRGETHAHLISFTCSSPHGCKYIVLCCIEHNMPMVNILLFTPKRPVILSDMFEVILTFCFIRGKSTTASQRRVSSVYALLYQGPWLSVENWRYASVVQLIYHCAKPQTTSKRVWHKFIYHKRNG